MGTKKSRNDNVKWLQNIIRIALKKEKKPVDMDILLAEFALNQICSLRTGQEIIKMFELTKEITIKDGQIIGCNFRHGI